MIGALRHAVPVCTAAEAAALDRAAIARGTPDRTLMARAGAAAAAEIARRLPELSRGALILAGPGNNGGDGWVVARALSAAGVRVRVWEAAPARTESATAERTLAIDAGVALSADPSFAGEGVVIDALLGTGARLPLRGEIVVGVRCALEARARGARLVALDLPTGVDATSGELDSSGTVVAADLTITFGTFKRGHLIAREPCGGVAVVDIGLAPYQDGASSADGGLPVVMDGRLARALLPDVAADSHKGTRRRIAIVAGGAGMAGAAILAARGALRSGAGLVKTFVHPDNIAAVQQAVPQALCAAWSHRGGDGIAADVAGAIASWADVVAIGPGLGAGDATRALVERVLRGCTVPAVLDADALNVFAGALPQLAQALGGRAALLTPHPAEMMRLAGMADVESVLAARFDVGREVARATGAAVLLKGVPTVISGIDGRRLVSAAGTAALATGGSGDVLTGIAATMLAQTGDALVAGGIAAWAHGRAGELATIRMGTVRGVALDEVLDAIPDVLPTVWSDGGSRFVYPVIAELPSVGGSHGADDGDAG